jgi:AcrR family transcriptional regulator
MSPRKPAVLRGGDGQELREYLIASAARLIGERGTAGLSVRDIAREAHVADGVLYNYFEDKEDLLAHALLAHVGGVMGAAPAMPSAGTSTVAENLRRFIDLGLEVLGRVTPAFAGLLSQPGVLTRFHALVGGDRAFGAAAAGGEPSHHNAGQDTGPDEEGPRGLPDLLTAYLRGEQRIGRIDAAADIEAASKLIIGAIHGQIVPRLLFNPAGGQVPAAPGLAARLAQTILDGIAPRAPRRRNRPGAPPAGKSQRTATDP